LPLRRDIEQNQDLNKVSHQEVKDFNSCRWQYGGHCSKEYFHPFIVCP